MEQFNKEASSKRGFEVIYKVFNVLNFVDLKKDKWYDSLNSSKFWGKPFICIINRAYLTTMNKYENIKASIDLVIHDECHSIENNTTQSFYKWLFEKNICKEPKVIGFSATPEIIKPLDKILTKYSIYQGFIDKVILPPKIIWIKSRRKSEFEDIIKIIEYNNLISKNKRLLSQTDKWLLGNQVKNKRLPSLADRRLSGALSKTQKATFPG